MEFVDCAANWLGKDIENSDDWIHYFSTHEINEIKSALSDAESSIVSLGQLTRDNFRLPGLSQIFAQMQINLRKVWALNYYEAFP